MPPAVTSCGENVEGLPLRPSVHPRPPVRGPAQGGPWPGLLCDLQPAPPSLAPFLCGRGRLCSGLGRSCLGSLLSLTSPGDPGGLGGELLELEADFWGHPWPLSRCLMGFHRGGSSSWPQPCLTRPAHTRAPQTKALRTSAGRTHRESFEEQSGFPQRWRRALLERSPDPGSPALAHGPPLRARPGMARARPHVP